MTWMLTVTGSVVDLQLAMPHQISVLDIAHALSLINRYHGHTRRPYSVAEHSLLVVEIMERELGEHDPQTLLAALMHDAHEAYTHDLAAPLKEALQVIARRDGRNMSDYMRVERELQMEVLCRFDLYPTYSRHHEIIKQCDLIALATERRDLMPAGGPAWPALNDVSPVSWITLEQRAGLGWDDWRQAFLDRFATLHTLVIDEELG